MLESIQNVTPLDAFGGQEEETLADKVNKYNMENKQKEMKRILKKPKSNKDNSLISSIFNMNKGTQNG